LEVFGWTSAVDTHRGDIASGILPDTAVPLLPPHISLDKFFTLEYKSLFKNHWSLVTDQRGSDP
jgi:hypothetical protein